MSSNCGKAFGICIAFPNQFHLWPDQNGPDRYAYRTRHCAYSQEEREPQWMNLQRVLCNMGTWGRQFILQRLNPGPFLVLWPSVSRNDDPKRGDFQLTSGQASLISYTGATKTTVASPLTAPKSSLIENKGLLPKVHPELAAGWSLVSNETFSHVITTTSEICDPQVSSLLDLGHAVDFENDDSGNRVVPIAVFASGECGNFISFRRIEEDTLELRQPTTWMRVPSIGEAESAEWPTGGAPVRQICFSRTIEEKATWMAADRKSVV